MGEVYIGVEQPLSLRPVPDRDDGPGGMLGLSSVGEIKTYQDEQGFANADISMAVVAYVGCGALALLATAITHLAARNPDDSPRRTANVEEPPTTAVAPTVVQGIGF